MLVYFVLKNLKKLGCSVQSGQRRQEYWFDNVRMDLTSKVNMDDVTIKKSNYLIKCNFPSCIHNNFHTLIKIHSILDMSQYLFTFYMESIETRKLFTEAKGVIWMIHFIFLNNKNAKLSYPERCHNHCFKLFCFRLHYFV